jgi:hypothetical protein
MHITIVGGGSTELVAVRCGGCREASVRIVESFEQPGGQASAVYGDKHTPESPITLIHPRERFRDLELTLDEVRNLVRGAKAPARYSTE